MNHATPAGSADLGRVGVVALERQHPAVGRRLGDPLGVWPVSGASGAWASRKTMRATRSAHLLVGEA